MTDLVAAHRDATVLAIGSLKAAARRCGRVIEETLYLVMQAGLVVLDGEQAFIPSLRNARLIPAERGVPRHLCRAVDRHGITLDIRQPGSVLVAMG